MSSVRQMSRKRMLQKALRILRENGAEELLKEVLERKITLLFPSRSIEGRRVLSCSKKLRTSQFPSSELA